MSYKNLMTSPIKARQFQSFHVRLQRFCGLEFGSRISIPKIETNVNQPTRGLLQGEINTAKNGHPHHVSPFRLTQPHFSSLFNEAAVGTELQILSLTSCHKISKKYKQNNTFQPLGILCSVLLDFGMACIHCGHNNVA